MTLQTTDTGNEPLFADAKGREVAPPDFGGLSIADTHAHLDMLEEPTLALARAARAGVGLVATVADPSEDASRTYKESDAWREAAGEGAPRVRVLVGVHPHNAKNLTPEVEAELRRLAGHAKTSAIGEIGLDYHYDYSPRDRQREAFRRQLEIAHELDLPAVVHLREAHEDGEAILAEIGVPPAGCILHCYTLGPSPLDRFLAMGCFVSFAGPVTFKKADEIREAAATVPLGRLLTETDCPFMAPEPFRGRANEPALVIFTAARLAETRGEALETFAAETYANALGLLDRERS